MDYYLKAKDEETLWSALEKVGAAVKYDVKDEEGNVLESRYQPASGVSIDLIGTISKPTGNLIKQTIGEDQTIEVPEMEALEGFHANLRGDLDLSEKIEYILPEAVGNQEGSELVEPLEPIANVTPSPIADILVYPKNPVRVWA